MEAAFIPEVNDELDTQNFEKFEEVKNDGFFVLLSSYCNIVNHYLLFLLNFLESCRTFIFC